MRLHLHERTCPRAVAVSVGELTLSLLCESVQYATCEDNDTYALDESVRLLLPIRPLEDRQWVSLRVEDPLIQGYKVFV